jgi:hypothetical protein
MNSKEDIAGQPEDVRNGCRRRYFSYHQDKIIV